MSFTAEVKDELSRVEAPTAEAELAQLSALIRVCDLDPRYVYVTDGGVSKEIAKEFAEKNCNLITGE